MIVLDLKKQKNQKELHLFFNQKKSMRFIHDFAIFCYLEVCFNLECNLMKKYLFLAVIFSLFTSSIYAQNSDVKVGDVFTVGEAHNNSYKHINFPTANFILKKGGIASCKKIKGAKVMVTSVDTKKDGSVVATIKLTSNKSFFNSHKYVTVDIDEAIREKELL